MANRNIKAAALLAAPMIVLSGCGSDEQADETATSVPTPAGTDRLTAQLATADGTPVADATFDFANGFARITLETIESGVLSPGFHGMHIHSVGKCEADSAPPTGGDPGDFLSAGGHFQAPGHTGHPASGDLTSLHVRPDGAAELVTTTEAFTAEELLGGEGTALMIHQGTDNFGHIPDRYRQPDGTPGPDQETLSTGDAGARVACGVIGSASGTPPATTSPTTTTTTTPGTVTETTVIPPAIVPPPLPGNETMPPDTTTAPTTTTAPPTPTTTTVEPPVETTQTPPPEQG